MRILVVGGSGCLGREIVDHAVRKGHEVTATFNSSPGTIAGADWTGLDIRHRTDVRELVNPSRPQVIVNTAFVPDDWTVTATGSAHVALAAADVTIPAAASCGGKVLVNDMYLSLLHRARSSREPADDAQRQERTLSVNRWRAACREVPSATAMWFH
ncbi:MAG: sugar nucleotide-binding protein, partial [Actinomycetota bacterium]|nr:sugar nucleotide-binding protein [Actinomycetota bacterium]